MIYLPHDLLRIDAIDNIGFNDPSASVFDASVSRPEWVGAALSRAPWVVVRRARMLGRERCEGGAPIPVGVRGMVRSERHGMWIAAMHVRAHVRPEQLVTEANRITLPRHDDVPAVALARALVPVFARFGLRWGPTGSVGFEWASGMRTTHERSDLDLIVRCERVLSRTTAAALLAELETRREAFGDCRIDANVETPFGSFSLAEYATGRGVTMLRTVNGPRLTSDLWAIPTSQ